MLLSVVDCLNARGEGEGGGGRGGGPQWLSVEQMRLRLSGHPEVHFETVVVGFWGWGEVHKGCCWLTHTLAQTLAW